MKMAWDPARRAFDLVRTAQGGVDASDPLSGAVIASLFTDTTADPADMTPDLGTDRRGWWADAARFGSDRMGSLIWLEHRQKLTEPVRRRLEEKAAAALDWLIEDGVASEVTVAASFPVELRDTALLDVAIVQPNGVRRDWKVELLWAAFRSR
jgi:phage gp46-like protein